MSDIDEPFPAGSFDIAPRRRRLAQDEPSDLPDHVIDESDFSLYVRDIVVIGIREYAQTDPENEVGGVLYGRHFQRGAHTVVEVREFLPLPSDSTSRVHFSFDAKALQALHQPGLAHQGDYLIGWFHTHVRLGDPFMSIHDIELHKFHFPEPWYVSCVVDGGMWAQPAGFWRMVDGELVLISEHYLHMTRTDTVGAQSRRFVRAAVAEERPLHKLLETVSDLTGKLVSGDSAAALRPYFAAGEIDEVDQPQGVQVLFPVAQLIDLAIRIAGDAGALAAARQLRSRLCQVRFLDDSLMPVLSANKLHDRIALHRHRCFSMSPGTAELYCADLVANLIWRLPFEPPHQLADLTISSSGALWLLTVTGTVLHLLPGSEETPLSGSRRTRHRIIYRGFDLPGLTAEPAEILALGDSLYIRTASEFMIFDIGSSQELPNEVVLRARYPLPPGEIVMLRGGSAEEGIALALADGVLYKLDERGETVAKADLDPAEPHTSLLAACQSTTGILALLSGEAGRFVCQLDPHDLKVVGLLVEAHRGPVSLQVHSLAVDTSQRAYLKRDHTISLIRGTGTPDPDWYLIKG